MEVYELIVAILRQAKEDYIRALRKRDYAAINELETFFLSEYGQTLSLDSGEEIIKWCQKLAKSKNSKGRAIMYKGTVKTLGEWADIKGIDYNVLKGRLDKGWTIERVLEQPIRVRSKEVKK